MFEFDGTCHTVVIMSHRLQRLLNVIMVLLLVLSRCDGCNVFTSHTSNSLPLEVTLSKKHY